MTTAVPEPVAVRRVCTPDLTARGSRPAPGPVPCLLARRRLLDRRRRPRDGRHPLAGRGRGRIVGHASVVPRLLEADGVPMATGYVEAVATHPDWRRRGIASRLVTLANEHIAATFELGALSTDLHARVCAGRVGALARADVRAHGRRPGADRGRGRRDHDPAHAADAAAHAGPRRSAASGAPATPGREPPGAISPPVRPSGRCRPRARSRPSRPARTSRASGSLGPSEC